MELILFWAIINALVGAAIGQRKKAVGACVTVSILLGPIGWIISFFIEGDVRKCPFCAETIQDRAVVCPHCRRDLAPAPAAPTTPPTIQRKPHSADVPDPADVKRVRELVRRYEHQPPRPDTPYRIDL
jgi:hypothetical protein